MAGRAVLCMMGNGKARANVLLRLQAPRRLLADLVVLDSSSSGTAQRLQRRSVWGTVPDGLAGPARMHAMRWLFRARGLQARKTRQLVGI